MATNFPTTLDSYTTKSNNITTIDASHVNDLQDAVVALETAFGTTATRKQSWVPTISFASGSATIGYATQTGSWGYIGPGVAIVSASVALNAFTVGTASGALQIALPVAASDAFCTGWIRGTAGFTTNYPQFVITAGSVLNAFYSSTTAAPTAISAANISASTAFRFSIVYFV